VAGRCGGSGEGFFVFGGCGFCSDRLGFSSDVFVDGCNFVEILVGFTGGSDDLFGLKFQGVQSGASDRNNFILDLVGVGEDNFAERINLDTDVTLL